MKSILVVSILYLITAVSAEKIDQCQYYTDVDKTICCDIYADRTQEDCDTNIRGQHEDWRNAMFPNANETKEKTNDLIIWILTFLPVTIAFFL